MYDLHYYEDEGLHTLEAFAEGTFNIGNIQVTRKFLNSGTPAEERKQGGGDDYTYYTRV